MSEQSIEMYRKVAGTYFGNANSLHDAGSSAQQIKQASLNTIAKTLGARHSDLHFTAGATDANFLALRALLDGCKKEGKHVITSRIEHSSVRNVFLKLEQEGYEVSWLQPDNSGIITPAVVLDALREDTVLVSIQMINSEIGTIQPIPEIGELLRQQQVLFHTDAVQAFGKIKTDVQTLNVDSLSISAHKIYGPKNMGAVWFRTGTEWKPYLEEVSQRKKLRPGTDDIPAMAAFAAAAKEIVSEQEAEYRRIELFKTALTQRLQALDYEMVVEGHPEHSTPYILGLRFPGMEGQFLMLECSQAGLAISTGSACQVGIEAPNRTMKAIGRTDEQAREFVRLSFGKLNTESQVDEIILKIDTILSRHFSKVHR